MCVGEARNEDGAGYAEPRCDVCDGAAVVAFCGGEEMKLEALGCCCESGERGGREWESSEVADDVVGGERSTEDFESWEGEARGFVFDCKGPDVEVLC